jgi:hypothetical protein
MFKATPYTGKHVDIYLSESMVRFFRMAKSHLFLKEMLVAMKNANVTVLNEAKSQIQQMEAVYSGFMRNNLISWIENLSYNAMREPLVSYQGTRAWYDVLVHEGLGVHASPAQKIPDKYKPSMEQLAIVPSFKEKIMTIGRGKHKGIKGPRPFYTIALKNSFAKINLQLANGFMKGIRNTVGADMGIPKHKLSSVFSSLGMES